MAALIFPVIVIALTLVPEAVGLLEAPVTRGPEPTQTVGVREVSATAEGRNVTLKCRASEMDKDATVNCSRGNQTVCFYRDGLSDPDGQDPSYVDRVECELKNDSLSVILRNVSFTDSGTFECFTKELKGPKEEVITSDLCSLLLSVPVSDTQVNVTAGGNATLDCRAHIDGSIEQIIWNKTDLESGEYVFFRGNRTNKGHQLPSFRGRVELFDPQMKQGEASVVLKNVTTDDSGIYECVVSMSSGGHRKRAALFIHKVHLKVGDSGPTAGGSEEGGRKEGGSQERGRKEGGSEEGGNPLIFVWVIDLIVVGFVRFYGVNVFIGFIVFIVFIGSIIIIILYKRPMKKKSEQPADEQNPLTSPESVEVQCESSV